MTGISDLDVVGLLEASIPQGAGSEDDSSLVTTGTVQELDITNRRVRVTLRGGGNVWLPAVAARYRVPAPVRILMDPSASRPVLVLGPVVSRDPAVLGIVTAGPTGGKLTVTFEGASYTIPAPMGAYSTGYAAWLLLDDWGVPVLALGPSSDTPANPGTGAGGGGTTVVTAKATIGPQSTGTWRSGYGWDSWGNDIHGGVADLYQGNAYGSGALVGLACYGDQIVNLGAIAIQRATLTARRNGSGTGTVPLTVQGSPHGTRPGGAPASSGSTASTGGMAINTSTDLDLPADVCEALRTGGAKGLAVVGGGYAGFGGTTTPGSFVLQIQYTRNA